MANSINLGSVTAYSIAVKYGFQGTEQEWMQNIMNASEHAEDAAESAEEAAQVVADLQSITQEIGSLIIVLGEDEYIYDGSSDITISIPDADDTQY